MKIAILAFYTCVEIMLLWTVIYMGFFSISDLAVRFLCVFLALVASELIVLLYRSRSSR